MKAQLTRRGLFALFGAAPAALAAPPLAPAVSLLAFPCTTAAKLIQTSLCYIGALLPEEMPPPHDLDYALGLLNERLVLFPEPLARAVWATSRPPIMQLGSPVPLVIARYLRFQLAVELAPLYNLRCAVAPSFACRIES